LRELVAAARELLLLGKELRAGCIELLLCADPVLGHAFLLSDGFVLLRLYS
jgi:hypothetical protein